MGRRDWRFSQNTIYSYLKMNLNYSWFLHRTSASRVVIPIWFEYWDVQSSHFGQPCNILVTVSLSMFSSTLSPWGQTSWAFFVTNLFVAESVPQNIMQYELNQIYLAYFILSWGKQIRKNTTMVIQTLVHLLAFISSYVLTRCIT